TESLDGSIWYTGALYFEGHVTNSRITHNYFHDTASMGMHIGTYAPGDNISGTLIANNTILRTVFRKSDGGAIYIRDGFHSSTGIQVLNNFIRDYSGPGVSEGKGIYLDDATSHAYVSGNVIAPPRAAIANQTHAVQIHGGNYNIIRNNIIDLGAS